MRKKIDNQKAIKANKSRSDGGVFFKYRRGRLDLADGSTFWGEVPSYQTKTYSGEVVFNTGMSGYVESMTDPSYSGQILVFTYPLIGNYGVSLSSAESPKIQVSGIVVSQAAAFASHAGSDYSLLEWLDFEGIPIITGVDTRALTKHLRINGTMAGAIGTQPFRAKDIELEKKFVTVDSPKVYNPKKTKKVILVDCGSKENILRSLVKLPLRVKRVPFDYDYVNEDYDGVLISNGPGNPKDYHTAIAITKKALKKGRPVFGICLGTQIMALAAGAKTYKLKFGHRGHNQPCIETGTSRAFITSQNHGYAIDAKSLPSDWVVSFSNLNDQSVEGIRHKTKPFFCPISPRSLPWTN